MTRRDFILKWTAYGAALLLTGLLNYYVLTFLPLSAVPLLLPAAAVAVGILEGAAAGAGFGIAAGTLMAAALHGSALWVCALSALGWACGLLAQYVLRRDLVGFLLACLTAGVVYEGGQLAFRALRGGAALSALLKVAAPEFFWTVVFAVPVYGMCGFCCRHYGRIYHE